MELSTGQLCQGETTPSDLVIKAVRRGLGRNYVSPQCKNRLDAFRFKGTRAHPAEEVHLQDICGSKPLVRGIINIPEGMDYLMMGGSGGNGATYPDNDELLEGGGGGQDPCRHESPQTDYGSTTMFDDEAWICDQDEQNCSKPGLIPGSDCIGGTRVLDLVGRAAAPGSWSELCSGGSDEKIAVSINMESVLGQCPGYGLECLEDEPYGGSNGALGVFGKVPNPLGVNVGPASNDIISTPCERPHSSYDHTLEQLVPPFTEEGFFLDRMIPSTSEHTANSGKCERLEPAGDGDDGIILVRCRAADVVKNGKIRWIDVSTSARRAGGGAPVWPLCLGRNRITVPIERPPFPAVVRERSLMHGLSAGTTVKTCFHIKDAVEVAMLVARAKFKGDVLVELFAKVLQNRIMDSGTRQIFQLCDIFLVGPPFLPGEYEVSKACGPWDTDSRAFIGTAMVRVVGRMNKRSNTREWILKIEDIRDVNWNDIDWVRDVVCGNGKN